MADPKPPASAPVFTPVAPAPPKAPKAPKPPASAPGGKASLRTKAEVLVTDALTGVKTLTEVVVEKVLDAHPVKVTLAAPYAFYDEAEKLCSWAAGQVVDDAEVIASLIARGALFVEE